MINEEGAIVPEQFRMVEMFDRMDCLGKAVLGLTTQCAQCHSHKFDPLTQDEYYGMFAFLNNTYEAQSWVYTRGAAAADRRDPQQRFATSKSGCERSGRSGSRNWRPGSSRLAAAAESPGSRLIATELGSISGLNHPTQEADQVAADAGHASGDVFMIAHAGARTA